jgi:hypothetical protein
MGKTSDTLTRVCEVAEAKNRELQRAINRILDGDTHELVRMVVEEVTEAMTNEVINTRMSMKTATDLIDRMSAAKFETFQTLTSRPFTTTTNRMLSRRKAERERKR